MALSGRYDGPGLGSGQYQRVYLTWSATQNIGANTSTISATLYWENKGYEFTSTTTKNVSITIAGETFTGTNTVAIAAGTPSSPTVKTLLSASKVVPHNGDGTLTTSISGIFELKFTISGSYYGSTSASGSPTLDTIPRASQITVFPNFTIGNGVAVTAPRATGTFTNEFQIYVGATLIHTTAKLFADSYTFTAANLDGIYALIPNAINTTATLYVNTWNGTTLIGQTSATALASVGTDIIPTLTSVSAAETEASITALALTANNFVQSLSRIKFTINGAAGVKSSTIASYKISFNGESYGQNGITDAVNKTGTLTVSATITDSRGRTSTAKTLNVTLIAYARPSITTFTATRNTTTATTVNTSIVASIASISSKNQLTYKVESKPRTSGTWTQITAPTPLAVGTTALNVTPAYTGYTTTSTYDFRVTITDKVGGIVVTETVIGTEVVPMSLSKVGIGVGKIWERGGLDVNGDIYSNGKLEIKNYLSFTAPSSGIYGYGVNWLEFFDEGMNSIIHYYAHEHRFNRMPAISSVDGVPGIPIIEEGSNANGAYIKFVDGTMICFRNLGDLTGLSIGAGTTYTSSVYAYPATFVGQPVLTMQGYATDGGGSAYNCHLTPHWDRKWHFFLNNNLAGTLTRILGIHFLAVGRWK